MSYDKFKDLGRVGCSACYSSFAEHLQPLLKKIHGAVRHIGKRSYELKDDLGFLKEKLEELKLDLDRVIKLEEFETAAIVRDEIKELETKINKK